MVQSLIQAYLRGAGFDAQTEVHEAKGRADLIVNTDNRRIVIEFKYAQNESEAKSKLSEAIEQIKTRDYGNNLNMLKMNLRQSQSLVKPLSRLKHVTMAISYLKRMSY